MDRLYGGEHEIDRFKQTTISLVLGNRVLNGFKRGNIVSIPTYIPAPGQQVNHYEAHFQCPLAGGYLTEDNGSGIAVGTASQATDSGIVVGI